MAVDKDLDLDLDLRDWKEVVWAMTTRMDPARDTMLIEHTPIDYLNFASPVSGLGSKMGPHHGDGCRRGGAYEGVGGCAWVVMQRIPAIQKETAVAGF